MNILQRLVLALAWMGFHSLVNSTIEEHPPVLEGSNVTLTCSGTTQSRDRIIFWNRETSNGSSVNIAKCQWPGQTCGPLTVARYKTIFNATGNSYISSLLILGIDQRERNMTFQCKVYDRSTDTSATQGWNMPIVFQAPENMRCVAQNNNIDNININCNGAKVYLGLVCDVYEIFNNMQPTKINSSVSYKREPIDSSGYVNASCLTQKTVLRPGSYKYRVVIFPDESVKDVKEAVKEITTTEVIISSSPAVIIRQLSVSPPIFQCTAYWLHTQPRFTWSIDHEFFNESNNSTTSIFEYQKSTSDLKFSNLTSYGGKLLKCSAQNRTSSSSPYKMPTTMYIGYAPYFTQDSNPFIKDAYVLIKGNMSKFECKVRDSEQKISSFDVKCKKRDQTEIIINQTRHNMSVSFHLNYIKEMNVVYCTCTVQYVNRYTTFTVSIVHGPSSSQWQPLNNKSIIMYIAGGFVMLIFIILLLGTLLFLYQRWEDLYQYVYGVLYSSAGARRANSFSGDGTFYSVVRHFASSRLSFTKRDSHLHQDSNSNQNAHPMIPTTPTSPELGYANISQFSIYNNLDSGPSIQDSHPLPPPRPPPRQPVLRSHEVIAVYISHFETDQDTQKEKENPHKQAPTACKKAHTDDGYLKPVCSLQSRKQRREQVQPKSQASTMNTNSTRTPPRPCTTGFISPDDAYLHLIPDVPPREPCKGMPISKPGDHSLPVPVIPPREPLLNEGENLVPIEIIDVYRCNKIRTESLL